MYFFVILNYKYIYIFLFNTGKSEKFIIHKSKFSNLNNQH
jgi:hypothetical protein